MTAFRRHWFLLVKVVVSCGVLALLLKQVSLAGVLSRLEALKLETILLLVAVVLLQTCLFATRWWLIAVRCEAPLPYVPALRLTFISMFFNQTLPGTIGGDMIRVVMSVQRGVLVGRAIAGVVVDRGIALLTLALMVLLSVPWLAHHLRDRRLFIASGVIGVTVVLGAGFAATVGPRLADRFSRWQIFGMARDTLLGFRGVCSDIRTFVPAVTLSAAIHLLSAIIVVILARSLGIALDLVAGIVLMLPSLLAMMLPVSIGGWGVREGAMVVALGQVGVSAENAFCLSVIFGLLFMAAGLPGAVLWLAGGQEARARRLVLQGSSV